MSRKYISQREISKIGFMRIHKLIDLSEIAIRDREINYARRYIEIARSIGMKTCVRMPKDKKICKKCHIVLMPGISCRVRLSNHKVCITCELCGMVQRIPYLREQLNDRKGREKGID